MTVDNDELGQGRRGFLLQEREGLVKTLQVRVVATDVIVTVTSCCPCR